MAKQLKNMDPDEFMEAWTKAAKDYDDARAKVREFAAENERREMERMVADLPDALKKFMSQTAGPDGIESQEDTNNG